MIRRTYSFPWNKWVDEINLSVADYLGRQRDAFVWEVIAGYNKYYFAVGDKLLVDKQDAVNSGYLQESKVSWQTNSFTKQNPQSLGQRYNSG